MKIAIIGYSGSGKSTLGALLAARYDLPLLSLDTLNFLPGWKERDPAEFQRLLERFMEQPGWVIEGNYSSHSYEQRLAQADRIIFLNFNRWNCLYRALKRYFQYRGTTRASMAEGCAEKFDFPFFWWIVFSSRTPRRRRKLRRAAEQYPRKVVVLKNQRQLDRYIRSETTPC